MRQNRSKRMPVRATVFLLLFAVAGLSTAAKQGRYLPKSDPLHRISKAAKMELLQQPVNFISAPTRLVSRIDPPEPEFSSTPLVQCERPPLSQIGLAVSFQHRAPPSLLV